MTVSLVDFVRQNFEHSFPVEFEPNVYGLETLCVNLPFELSKIELVTLITMTGEQIHASFDLQLAISVEIFQFGPHLRVRGCAIKADASSVTMSWECDGTQRPMLPPFHIRAETDRSNKAPHSVWRSIISDVEEIDESDVNRDGPQVNNVPENSVVT